MQTTKIFPQSGKLVALNRLIKCENLYIAIVLLFLVILFKKGLHGFFDVI